MQEAETIQKKTIHSLHFILPLLSSLGSSGAVVHLTPLPLPHFQTSTNGQAIFYLTHSITSFFFQWEELGHIWGCSGETYTLPEMKPRLTTCKASAISPVPLLSPLTSFFLCEVIPSNAKGFLPAYSQIPTQGSLLKVWGLEKLLELVAYKPSTSTVQCLQPST